MKDLSRIRLLALVLPAFVAGLAGCAPAGPAASDSPVATSAAQSTQAGPTTTVAQAGPTAVVPAGPAGPDVPPQAEAPVVRWVPIGPVGPNDPQEGRMYLFAHGKDCDNLRDGLDGTTFKDVWRAAAAVCYALRGGTTQQWKDADTALASMLPVPQDRCLEHTIAGVVRGVVTYHRAHPAQAVPLQPGTGESCPRKLTGLTVVDEQLKPVAGLARPSGPASGGTLVRLDGYYVRVEALLIDGVPSGAETKSDGDYSPVYFRTPPAEGRTSIVVSITDTLDAPGAFRFFYDAGQGSPSGGTQSGSPTGSPQGSAPASSIGNSSAGTSSAGTGAP